MPQQITMGGACHNVTGHTAPTSQSTNALTRLYATPVTPTKPTGALYVPFNSLDMLMQGAGFNIARLVAGKPLYPLIARDDYECKVLDQWRHIKVKQFTEMIDSINQFINDSKAGGNLTIDDICIKLGATDFDEIVNTIQRLQHIIDTMKCMEILSSQNRELVRLRPGVDKLYLLGHGRSGESKLAADTQGMCVITAAELACQLATGGLNPLFNDIRVSSCYSADTRYPESFESDALKRAALAEIGRSDFWTWFGYGPKTVEPFAQSLCNALKMAGFKQPVVYGYHGAGHALSTDHHYNCLPGTPEAKVRTSSVRQLFSPTV